MRALPVLTTLGFGDGNHAYIDSAQEAHKVLVRQREGTLTTIARDVKIQVEFNPAAVAGFGQLLAGGPYLQSNAQTFDYTAVDRLAQGAGEDRYGDRGEFRKLVQLAGSYSQVGRGEVGKLDQKVEAKFDNGG